MAGERTILRPGSQRARGLPAGIMHAFAILGEPDHHLDDRVRVPFRRSLRPRRLHRPWRVLMEDLHGTDVGRKGGSPGGDRGVAHDLARLIRGQPLVLRRDRDQPARTVVEQAIMELRPVVPHARSRERQARPVREGEHCAVALEASTESTGPAELEEGGDGRIMSPRRERGLGGLPQGQWIGPVLRHQPACLRLKRGDLRGGGRTPQPRARAVDGLAVQGDRTRPSAADGEPGRQDQDQDGSDRWPACRPGRSPSTRSCVNTSRHSGSHIVTLMVHPGVRGQHVAPFRTRSLRSLLAPVEWGHPGGQGGGRGLRTLSFLGLEAAERPRLNATSIRQLARLGTVVRWPGLLFAAILSLAVPPSSRVGLALVLGWVAVYNAWGMIAISKADDASIQRIGRALTLLDTLSYFLVLFVFGGVGASTSIYAAYILLIVWMVAYDGAEGAMLCVGIFVVGMIALHTALRAVFNQDFDGRDVLLWSLIMVVAGAILAAYDRIVVGGVLPQGTALGPDGSSLGTGPVIVRALATPVTSGSGPAGRLSPREQEALELWAEGYSHPIVSSRLHLSENTVKTYVENLLSRLNARNRAEAVAAASRQNLI